jgi:cytoskeletal protein CcmA (bactofilin family)
MSMEMTVTNWPVAATAGAKRSVLADDLELDGDVTSLGPVEVLGKIRGAVRAPDVLIAAGGRVDGQVAAHNLSVFGTINGTITAKSVLLCGSAQVQADITHDLITIDTGAQFDGSLRRKR